MPEIAYVKIENLATHPDKFVNVPDLADYWHVHEATVYRLAQKHAFKSIRIGRRIRVDRESAYEFEQAAGRPDEEREDGQGR
jgi:excisionase family DNA binding protein